MALPPLQTIKDSLSDVDHRIEQTKEKDLTESLRDSVKNFQENFREFHSLSIENLQRA